MDSKKIFILIIGLFCISCEKKFEVYIDGTVSTKQMHLECGTMTIEAYCLSRVFVFVTIHNDQKDTFPCMITFYPDLCRIIFKTVEIPYKIDINSRSLKIV